MKTVHIVIARYNERLDWLFNILDEYPGASASVYNDGNAICIPTTVSNRVTIIEGDKVPCEPTKYIKWILSNWNETILYDHVVFLQGDPVYHNPTLNACFKCMDAWNLDFQTLSLLAHPHPWPMAKGILNGTAPNVIELGPGAMVWYDDMLDNMQGVHFKDPFWDHFMKNAPDVTVTYYANMFGFVPPCAMKKCIAACFSTSSKKINQIPYNTWRALHDFVINGCPRTTHLSAKYRAVYMEYLWAVIFESAIPHATKL